MQKVIFTSNPTVIQTGLDAPTHEDNRALSLSRQHVYHMEINK